MLASCKESAQSNLKVDAEDVAWATGWNIYKWDIGKLSSKPIYGVSIVIIGADGEIIQEVGPIGDLNSPPTSEGEITVAFKKEEKKAYLKLRYMGSSITSKTKDVFDESHWGYSENHKVIGNLLVFATDSDTIPFDPEEMLKLKSNKVCLRFLTKK